MDPRLTPPWSLAWDAFGATLAAALRGPLPGAAAHAGMAVLPRPGWVPGAPPPGATPSAALVALAPSGAGPAVVLTRRAAGLRRHADQISFPGGRLEPGEDLVGAALREAREEIGLDPAGARVLGRLSPLHVPVTDFVIHPVVALLERLQPWERDPREVASVLEVPLEQLAAPGGRRVEDWEYEGNPYVVPLFPHDGEKIWGATAMILSELLWVLGRPVG